MRNKLLLLVFAAMSTTFADPILAINGPTTAFVGSIFTMTVDINDVTDLYAWQFDLNYRLPSQQYPQVADLAVVSILEGSFLQNAGPTFFAPGTDDPAAGVIHFNADTLLSTSPGQSGSGTLFVMLFQALSAGPSPLSLSNIILLDSTFNEIRTVAAPGFVNIVDTAEPPAFSLMLVSIAFLLVMWRRKRTVST
jgi:hypothetical protein